MPAPIIPDTIIPVVSLMAAATRLSKEIITEAGLVMATTVRSEIISIMSTSHAGRAIMAERSMTIITPQEDHKTTHITGRSLIGNMKTTNLIGKITKH
jgi:hypothetical protein